MSLRAVVTIALACLAVSGCAHLTPAVSNKPILPSPQMSRDTVVLEMTTVEIPFGNAEQQQQLWAEIDEQHLGVALRRRLSSAGIRVGVCGNELPAEIQTALALLQDEPQVASDDGKLVSVTGPRRRRLQCRSGERHQLVLDEGQKEMSVLWSDEGRVHGTTYANAQSMFVLRAFSEQSGQARLVLTPQISHGAPHSRWVGRDGMFLMETGKEQEKFEDLAAELTLAPGEYLIVSSTSEIRGLGECLFIADGMPKKQKVLILRLAQTQLDDLQPAVAADRPLVTGVD